MLDIVVVLAMIGFTVVTFLWIAACDHLLRTDSTSDTVEAEHARAWSTAPQQGQRPSAG